MKKFKMSSIKRVKSTPKIRVTEADQSAENLKNNDYGFKATPRD